jgi:hypothetical protein
VLLDHLAAELDIFERRAAHEGERCLPADSF